MVAWLWLLLRSAEAGCEFVGVYYTTQDENGDPVNKFLQLAGNVIEDTGSLTDEQKKVKNHMIISIEKSNIHS